MESNSVCNQTSDNKKSDDRAAGVRFVYHLPINHKNYNFREMKNSQVVRERENLHLNEK